MTTQQERDDALINGVHKAISCKSYSFLRVVLLSALTLSLGVWELSLSEGWLSSLMGLLMIIAALLLIAEGGRFGLTIARLYGGWASTTGVIMILAAIFITARVFEHWGFEPLHRTIGWGMMLWLGFVIGSLLHFAAEREDED
jgi:hypothetical protein